MKAIKAEQYTNYLGCLIHFLYSVNKSSLAQILFASATVLLSAAYVFSLHQEASHEDYNNYSSLITILFVPAIVSALSLLEYNRICRRILLNIGIIITLLSTISNLMYSYFIYKLVHDAGFKLNTGAYGLLNALPLGYLIMLAVGSLILKKM